MSAWAPLSFTMHPLAVKKTGGVVKVLDPVRKKWLVLTPEEWVRQHLILFLHIDLDYPISLMTTEIGHQGKKGIERTDLLVFNNLGQLLMLIECKEPNAPINEQTLFQLSRYQAEKKANVLAMTNGIMWKILDATTGRCLLDWPKFNDLPHK